MSAAAWVLLLLSVGFIAGLFVNLAYYEIDEYRWRKARRNARKVDGVDRG